MARKPQRYHCQKNSRYFFHLNRLFASEPMTLREIDHVSFLVEHAQTFFAGETTTKFTGRACAVLCNSLPVVVDQVVVVVLKFPTNIKN